MKKEWFVVRDGDRAVLVGVEKPDGAPDWPWRAEVKARCRRRWPDAAVFWAGKKKPATVAEEQLPD